MPTYEYLARDDAGKDFSGSMKAENRGEVLSYLRKQGLVLVDIKEKKSFMSFGKGALKKKVKIEEIVIFTRQLSTMISSGIPLLESLDILREQQENPGFKNALNEIVDRVRAGSDLSAAMEDHPKVFARIYVSMIKAGETAGQLDVILTRLAEYQEATIKLIREIKSAMMYPIISLTMIFGITAFLLLFIIPKFEDIFRSLDVTLPALTEYLLQTSKFLKENVLFVGGGMVALGIAFTMYSKTNIGKWQLDWFKLKMPVFGDLFQKVGLSRFSRTFATLIRSGVPILAALEIVSATSGNLIMEEAVHAAMQNVRQGEPLADPLSQYWVFPPMVTRMIAIGERAGALEQLLEKISEFYDQQVSATVDALTSLIEPLMIGIMGFLVGGIVLAVFLPIFELQSKLAG